MNQKLRLTKNLLTQSNKANTFWELVKEFLTETGVKGRGIWKKVLKIGEENMERGKTEG